MILVNSNSRDNFEKGTYIALGSFDGLHIGHMMLIDKAKSLAAEKESLSMVYTFKNHPLTVVNKSKAPKLIMDNDTKVQILRKSDVDMACFVEFNEAFMMMSPEEFIRQIKEQFNMKGVVVGFNFRFGHKNSGDSGVLRQLGEKYNFEVYVMDALKYEDEVVSSSRIRSLLGGEGNVEKANKMLTQPFKIKGEVIHGKKLGRTLGFPTANLRIYEELLYPRIGVYYTNVMLENRVYKGITSVGYNPTVQGKHLTFETYILDFNREIYDEILEVYFISRIRDEMKFNSLDDLVIQMTCDKAYAESKKIEL
jgi:riboflavin kinase/FMN adenylyltransferase